MKNCRLICAFMVTIFLQVLLIGLSILSQKNIIKRPEFESVNTTRKENITNHKARLNVVILTHMSSGSTLFGNTFNFHPDVFYLYEPLHFLRKDVYTHPKVLDMTVLDKKTEDTYRIDFSKLLHDIFTCSFKENKTIDYLLPHWLRSMRPYVNYLSWRSPKTQYTKNFMRNVCNSRRITVVKMVQNRLPGKPGIRELQRVCSSGPNQFQCLIIHLIRDPRAVLSSLIRRHFFLRGPPRSLITLKNTSPEGKGIIMQGARIICSTVEDNLNYANAELPNWFKGRYIVVRYEDIPGDLLRAVIRMYNFTGLPLTTTISKWITEGGLIQGVKTHSPEFFISKKDVDRIDHWRFRMSTSLVSEFEEVCWPLMYMMGYIPVNGSDHLLRDSTKKLWTENIPFPLPQ